MHRLIAILMALVASVASAQEDISLKPVSGTYTIRAQMASDLDTVELCVVRVDLDPLIEYGCAPAGPDEIVKMEISVDVTTNQDAEIRVFAVDTSGLVSDLSPNAGRIDFTRPAAPSLVQ